MKKAFFMSKKKDFIMGEQNVLQGSLDFVEETLAELGIERKRLYRTLLLAEEVIPQFLENGTEGSRIRVQVQRSFGEAAVTIRAAGKSFNLLGESAYSLEALRDADDMDDEGVQKAIRSILLKSQGENLKYANKNGENLVRIHVGQAERKMLALTVSALVLGIVFGMLLRLAFPAAVSDWVSAYLLNPVKNMFMNALQIVIGPVIFFSIVSCFSQFRDLSELGRIGAKVLGLYVITTIVAVTLGISLTLLFQPGEWGFALTADTLVETEAVSVEGSVDTAIRDMIVNTVPSNFLLPFLESDTLQIIFLAVLCGLAVGMIGQYAEVLQRLCEAFNSLFLTMTSIISKFIPAAVFCSISLLILDLGGSPLFSILGMAALQIVIMTCMLGFYGLMILALARLNPLTFFKKNREGMLTSFTLSSSCAAMPTNIKTCTDKLGISPKISSFSIPLGATINMDGTSIALAVIGLFLARAYAVPVPASSLVPLVITIIVLSLGAPGIPGSGCVCVAVVLNSLGVPIEGIGFIIGINALTDMYETMSNTTGDVAATLIVAKSEGLLDIKKFNR